MVQFEDCFTPEEWQKLMAAKEVANGSPVKLETKHPWFGDATTYTLSLGTISLIGEGFCVSDCYWPETEKILAQHFVFEER